MAADHLDRHSANEGLQPTLKERWALADPHREQLLAVARRPCLTPDDAEDTVYEAMVRAAAYPQLDPKRAAGLLTTMVMRICADQARRRTREMRGRARTETDSSTRLRTFVRGCATLLLLGVTASACGDASALAPNSSKWTLGTPEVAVGSKNYFGFTDLRVMGSDTVRLTGAAVQGAGEGLRIAGIYAVSMRETAVPGKATHYIADLGEDEVRRDYPGLRLHPVTDAVLVPGSPIDWYLVVIAVPTRPGRYTSTGIRVDYRVGGDTFSQTFSGWRIDVRCGSATAA
jgi:hypothetical protein